MNIESQLISDNNYVNNSNQSSPHHLNTISNQHNSFVTISNLLDNLNKNSLNVFYQNTGHSFKKQIDELNLKFYLETEKYLSNKKKDNNTQNSLFIILFKQISLYIDEIERLNLILQEQRFIPKNIKDRTDEIIKKQKEFETKEQLIKTLKDSKSHLESKLLELISTEDRLRLEIEKLKKENESLKEQISLLQPLKLVSHNTISNTKNNQNINYTNHNYHNKLILSKKRNYSDNNPTHKSNNSATAISNKHKPKKDLGIIKSVKEKLIRNASNETKMKSSGNFVVSPRICHSPVNQSQLKGSAGSDCAGKFMQDLKLDFLSEQPFSLYDNNKEMLGHVKTEVIVSDLEDYYNNNSNKINAMNEQKLNNDTSSKETYINNNTFYCGGNNSAKGKTSKGNNVHINGTLSGGMLKKSITGFHSNVIKMKKGGVKI